MELLLIWIGLFWAIPIVICIELGSSRNRTGWIWGFALGWFGVLILALMRPRTAADRLADLEAERRLAELGRPVPRDRSFRMTPRR